VEKKMGEDPDRLKSYGKDGSISVGKYVKIDARGENLSKFCGK